MMGFNQHAQLVIDDAKKRLKKIEVKYEEPKNKVIVSKADYFDGWEILFYEAETSEEVPF